MPTLSKEQATTISDKFFAQERQRDRTALSRLARFVQPFHQFPELSGLAPGEQVHLIRVATSKADKQVSVLLSGFVFAVVIPALAYFAPLEHYGTAAFIGAFAFAGIHLGRVRRAAVHRHVLEALAHKSTDQSQLAAI